MTTPLKLICETDFYDIETEVIQENQNQKPIVKIRGPYIVAEKRNGNGRRYLSNVMEEAVKTYDKTCIKAGRACGELNHPASVDVNYDRICHKINYLKRDGDTWLGESEVLTGHPKGDILASILRHGMKPGISTRGVGNVTADKDVDQYKLIAVDIVHEPSGPGCFMEGIFEAKDFMINSHGDIVEIAYDNLEQNLESLPRHSDEKSRQIYEAIKQFLNDF
jgi:hypothetical protein